MVHFPSTAHRPAVLQVWGRAGGQEVRTHWLKVLSSIPVTSRFFFTRTYRSKILYCWFIQKRYKQKKTILIHLGCAAWGDLQDWGKSYKSYKPASVCRIGPGIRVPGCNLCHSLKSIHHQVRLKQMNPSKGTHFHKTQIRIDLGSNLGPRVPRNLQSKVQIWINMKSHFLFCPC